jgi:hypothetical protein
LEITKTASSLMLVVITILTTLTTIAAYAGEGGGDGNDDGNRQKAEDDPAAAIADCDDNDVERAGFDCIAIAANDVEIELPSEEPPGEGLIVCKEVEDPNQEVEPIDFTLTVTDSSGATSAVLSQPPPACEEEIVPVSPGEYEVIEAPDGGVPSTDAIEVEGDCIQDPTNEQRATGEIQAGETQECRFTNFLQD